MKILLINIFACLFTNSTEHTPYKQQVTLQKSFFYGVRGEIVVDNDSIYFTPTKLKNEEHSFRLSKKQITKVKKLRAYVLPNRLLVQTQNSKYVLYTYKRKKLIENLLLQ